jgi:hypothetical protein
MAADKQANHESEFDQQSRECYCKALRALGQAGVPFVVGGAFAFRQHTGITRHTKDLDVFIRPRDLGRTLQGLSDAGLRTEVTYRSWLAKGYLGDYFLDVIFNLGNGIRAVDDDWFRYALEADLFGEPVQICPPEEMLWSKAFTMARDRYDGADVAHLLRARGKQLDWKRLLRKFDEHWPVLYSHLVLFGYIYPGERDQLPQWVMEELADRLHSSMKEPPAAARASPPLCRGTMVGAEQYHVDTEEWGYQDARQRPWGTMGPDDLAQWKQARAAGK